MYVGRFVVVGPTVAAYRVSSRSFPNRQIVERDGALTVTPTPDAPETDNPYISYNCVREVAPGGAADGEASGVVIGNGSQVDPVAEKIDLGYPARDALAESLLALDYEKDDYDTPRIAGVVGVDTPGARATLEEDAPGAYVGIVRKDGLLVERVTEPTLVATYEEDSPRSFEFDAQSAAAAARAAYDLEFEHAVCAAGVRVDSDGVETAVENGE
jgi:IMP cyclohydrolase